MFKSIAGSSLVSGSLVLALFEFKRSNTFHAAKTRIVRNEDGSVFDYSFVDGTKLNLNELPTRYMAIPEDSEFTELSKDLSNAPLHEDVLVKFPDGSIENATFELSEDEDEKGVVVYWLFDGESLKYNPTHFMKMPNID